MHQTKKGTEWHYGMKVYSSVDVGSGYLHTITGIVANIHTIVEISKLVREETKYCTEISAILD